MRLNPITKELFTDDGRFIKRMSCPYAVDRLQLGPAKADGGERLCGICRHSITDTAGRSDAELLRIAEADPTVCFKLDLQGPNLRVTDQRNIQ